MKKTLLVTLDFYPSLGGIAKYWELLGREMNTKLWVVLAPLLKQDEKELAASYPIIRGQFLSSWVNPHWFPVLLAMRGVIKKEHIELVIAGQVLPIGVCARIIRLLGGPRYIVSCHGTDVMRPLANKWKRSLATWVFNGAAGVITNTQFTKTIVGRYGVLSDKISVVYPCVSLPHGKNNFEHRDKALLDQLSGKKILLSVGRLIERKGYHFVIEAIVRMQASNPDVVYVIIGEGVYRKELEVLVSKYNLSDRVFLLGKRESADLQAWYRACTMFILTPFEDASLLGDVESFGAVYLEAALLEKPVIASRTGGVNEAVVDGVTGILVAQKNIGELVVAIERLLGDSSLCKTLGQAGKTRVISNFSARTQAANLQRILER